MLTCWHMRLKCKGSHEVSKLPEKAAPLSTNINAKSALPAFKCIPFLKFSSTTMTNPQLQPPLFHAAWMPGFYLPSIKGSKHFVLIDFSSNNGSLWADCGGRRPHPARPELREPAPQFGLDKGKPGKKTASETIRAFSLHTVLCSTVPNYTINDVIQSNAGVMEAAELCRSSWVIFNFLTFFLI